MTFTNFHSVSSAASGQANDGQGKSAQYTPAVAYAPVQFGYRAAARAGEQYVLEYLRQALGGAFPRHLITSYYISLKTNPFVVLTGHEGAGKAALVAGFAAALTGASHEQFVTIGSNSWTRQGGVNPYYQGIHERFGSLQFLETLQEAAAPEHLGKLFMVLLKGLSLDEIDYYFNQLLWVSANGEKRLALPGLLPGEWPILPPNVFFTATLHVPQSGTLDEAEILRHAGQIAFGPDLHAVDTKFDLPMPPVGLQRIMLNAATDRPQNAYARLVDILGQREIKRLAPSPELAGLLRNQHRTLNLLRDQMLAYVANSFDSSGSGLFDLYDARRNAQIAYDDQVLQRFGRLKITPQPRMRYAASVVQGN